MEVLVWGGHKTKFLVRNLRGLSIGPRKWFLVSRGMADDSWCHGVWQMIPGVMGYGRMIPGVTGYGRMIPGVTGYGR